MSTIKRYDLFLLLCVIIGSTFMMIGCEEALTDSNNKNIPEIDGTGEPWVEFAGSDATQADRGQQVAYTVTLGHTPDTDSVTVSFSVSDEGNAQSGRDFNVLTESPITIPIDPSNRNLEEGDLVVSFPSGDVDETKVLTLQLDEASSASGESIPVGRGGSDDNDAKTILIQPGSDT